jgi:SHS2 domain-containing protein
VGDGVRYTLPQPYRDLEHTADAGVMVEGATAGEALARLVLAEAALLSGGAGVDVARDERVTVTGPSSSGYPGIAIALLRELLFRFATERVLAGACEVVRLDEGGAEVVVGFGPFDPERHAEGLDLKAVTRHATRFELTDGAWRAQVVFDI